jgi:hypothetical protein
MLRLELFHLQVDDHIAMQLYMIEEQI